MKISCTLSLSGVRNAQNLEFFICQPDSAQHQTVAAQRFNGVNPHTAHQFLDFMLPCLHQIDKALASNLRIETLYQFRTLGCSQ